MGEIESLLFSKDNIIVEAFPGAGKTKYAVQSAFQRKSALIVVRTVSEMFEVLRFSKSYGTIIPLWSRRTICPLASSIGTAFYSTCRAYRKLGRYEHCISQLSDEFVKDVYRNIRNPEKLRLIGTTYKKCPYNAVLRFVSSRYCVATYEYVLLHNEIPEKELVIYDEFHHLIDMIMSAVEHIPYKMLKGREGYAIRSVLKKYAKGELSRYEAEERITRIAEFMEGEVAESIVRGYFSFDRSGLYIFPQKLVLPIGTSSTKLLSAFVPSFIVRLAEKILGIKLVKHTIVPDRKQDVVIDGSVTSLYRERSEDMYKQYAELIDMYVIPDALNLVVFPSYDFMEKVLQYMKSETTRKPADKGVLIDVAGGQYTEGVNLPETLKTVIVAGMPYPVPTPELRVVEKVVSAKVGEYIALLRTIQALGRLRLREDTVGILLDKRFLDVELPEWINAHDITC
ncbi:MAG: hypothetical protein GXO26_01675 [Crenarchaeota archaeon]|nr:hypothetical protein [Thermoproteota archaeon]